MSFTILQAGSVLQRMSTSGVLTTLTLPADVTIDAALRGRFAVLDRTIIFVRAPNRLLAIDADSDSARPLAVPPPVARPVVAAGTGTGLTGAYRVRIVNKVKSATGETLARSAPGPESLPVTLTDQTLAVSEIPIALDAAVNCRGIERTLVGGNVFYDWADLDDNRSTVFEDGLADAALELLPSADDAVLPPGALPNGSMLSIIAAWKHRLWGVSTEPMQVDHLLGSAEGIAYSWPLDFAVQPVGADQYGITALLPRRDELGIAKRNAILKVIGDGEDTFEVKRVVVGTGCRSQETVVVIRDIAYFLASDGVYRFGPDGVDCVSENVHAWFTTDTYFNRALFDDAWAQWNPVLGTYDLHLAAAGSSNIDRYVSLYVTGPKTGKWLGPHKTTAFTKTIGGLLEDANAIALPVIAGSDGYVYAMNQAARTDGAATAIDFDVDSVRHSANTPDIVKLFRFLRLRLKKQTSGTLTITPTVGDLDAAAQASISHDMTVARRQHRRLGLGRFVQLNFRNNENAVDVSLEGYEIPYHEVGPR